MEVKDEKKKKAALVAKITVWILSAVILFAMLYKINEDDTAEEETMPYIGVHIKGAVEDAGFYEVPMGTRVCDVGEVAGGFTPDADLDSVNLAGFLEDGEEVYIPYKGSVEKNCFNLNTITENELDEKIEGIGEGTARKIIEYRESHNGFKEVIELKMILGGSLYKKVSEQFYIE